MARLVAVVSVLSFIYSSALAQTVEQRLSRIEVKLDSLLALQSDSLPPQTGYTVLKNDSNLQWGIASEQGVLLNKGYYLINYVEDFDIPYWVAYHLAAADINGPADRTDDFRPDPELVSGRRAELEDYRNSGYDRGHNAPAGDFQRSREAMSTTFLLSNMSPQIPRLNRYIWKNLEEQTRQVTESQGEAWIVTGNLFLNEDNRCRCPLEYIGPHHVAVPTHLYKSILTLAGDGHYSLYAFLLPNQRDQIPGQPADYEVTVDSLEALTGYDFFPVLDDSLEDRLESHIAATWPR